jgi:hypothetical protein
MQKIILVIFSILIIFCTASAQAQANYNMPIGIPDPADYFGVLDPINDSAPVVNKDGTSSYCPSWPSLESSGCFFIDKTNVNCNNSDNNGYPDKPRCQPPEGQLNAGDFIYFNDGVYGASDSAGDRFDWHGDGTDTNPIWIVGNPDNNPILQDYIHLGGNENLSYLIIDSLEISGSDRVNIDIRSTSSGGRIDHVVIRNCVMKATGTNADSTAIKVGAEIDSTSVEYIVAYNNDISSFGNWSNQVSDDWDEAGFMAGGFNTHYLWVLDNSIYNVGADSVAGCHRCDASEVPQYYYIGGNTLYGNDENGIDLKGVKNVVISENEIYGPYDENEAAIILHYGQYSLPVIDSYVIFNKIYNASAGIACTACRNVHAIGNIIYDINRYVDVYSPGSDAGSGAAIRYRGASGVNRIVDNTIYDVETGIIIPSSGTFEMHGNIITNKGEPTGYDFYVESGSVSSIDYSIISNPKIRWQGLNYTTLEDFIIGTSQCVNCDDTDPFLVNPPSDFSLQSDSPCRDANIEGPAGDSAYNNYYNTYSENIEMDISGIPRPQGSGWDIGAYEYQDGQTLPPTCTDQDNDGYGFPASSACTYSTLDCNDSNSNINPGVTEICGNNIDEDCSGSDLPCEPRQFNFQFQKQSKPTHQDTAAITLYTPGTSNILHTISNKQTNTTGQASNISHTTRIDDGTYDILIKIPYHLPKRLENQTWPPSSTLNFGELKSGDTNNDNQINAQDLSIILSNWQTSHATSDLNGDGQVNSLDFSYINNNWNQNES